MRTRVGHRAAAQVLDEILQFAASERVIRLHGVAANGLGHGMFAQPHTVDLLPHGFEFVHEIHYEPTRVGHLHEWWQCVEEECLLTEFAQANAQPCQCRQLLAQKLRVARRQLDGFRQQQFL